MDASSRKNKILCCVVEQYINTSEPIGSKQLLEYAGLNVSSATIRNEMALLSEAGLLHQPHTSAGRIPTQEGYRHYLDVSNTPVKPSSKEKKLILEQIALSADDPERILDNAAKVLSQLCKCVGAATTPPPESVKIAKLRIVQTGIQTAMSVLITSSGMVKYRLFRCDYVLTHELVKVFEKLLNQHLVGFAPEEITPAFIQNMAAGFGELAMLMPNLLGTVMQQCEDINRMDLKKYGESNLLFYNDFQIDTLRDIMRFLSAHEPFARLLLKADLNGGILLGTETGTPELFKCAVLSRRYNVQSQPAGVIGIVAPLRNGYRKNLGIMEYVSSVVGKLISGLLET